MSVGQPDEISKIIDASIEVKQQIDAGLKQRVCDAADAMIKSLQNQGRILAMGNGGSASDAQHLVGELVGRFLIERKPMDAIAITTNTATITSVLNDYSGEYIYSRQVEAYARPGDVVIGISTSGNSANVVKAMQVARDVGAVTIALTGETGGKLAELSDILLNVPSTETPRIQESHILIIHILCELVERVIAKN